MKSFVTTLARRTALVAAVGIVSCTQSSSPPPQPANPTTQPTPAAASPATQASAYPDYSAVPFKPIAVVEKRGMGPIDLVLVPDLTCDWSAFDAFMSRNQERYTMYAVTLPGFGGTEPPQAPLDQVMGPWLDNADKAIMRMIKENNLHKPVIVGHNLGGHMALRLGIEHPDELRAAISINGWPAMPIGIQNVDVNNRKSNVLQFRTLYKMLSEEDWQRTIRDQIMATVTDSKRGKELADIAARTPRDTTLQYMIDLFSADLTDKLADTKTPTLVIAAIPTRELLLEQIAEYRANWAQAVHGARVKLAFFENTRPFVQDDRPAELDAAIESFLAGKDVQDVVDPSPGLPQEPSVPPVNASRPAASQPASAPQE